MISSEVGEYKYTLATNPKWDSFFRKFCDQFELIEEDFKLEPSKLECRYVCFTVYKKPDGSEVVRCFSELEDELVELLLCDEEEAA